MLGSGAVHKPVLSVPVRDLERSDQRRTWDLPSEWVTWAMSETEAESDGLPGKLEIYLKKTGREVLVKGVAEVSVTMPCARTLDPVPVALKAEIMLLLTPRPGAAAGPRKSQKRPPRTPEEESKEEQLTQEQAARDEYDGETIELDGFVREHLLLELPLFPVRSDLPFDAAPATDTRPDDSSPKVDPRLAPLAALAAQLQGKLPGSDN